MCFRLLVAAVLVAFPAVLSQGLYTMQRSNTGSCPVLSSNSEVFGNRTAFSNQGLLPTLFIINDGSSPLNLRIRRVHLLCEAIGLYRNTASSASYLVEYEVSGVSTPRLAQVSVDCIADSFNPSVNYSFFPAPQPGSNQTIDLNTARNSLGKLVTDRAQIVSNFTTESAFTCGRCGPQGGIFADQATRCVFCNNCTQGMMRCLGRDENQCCSWFMDDRCVQFCPSPLVGDPDTFDCGCPRLSLTNGAVTYSSNLLIGSVANYTCDATIGYVLTPGSPTTRNCTINDWTGDDATCELFDCKMTDLQNPDSGDFTLATGTTTFGSMATFKCNDKYQLSGASTRTCGLNGWSDKNPTCERKDDATNRLPTGIIAVIVVVCIVVCLILGVVIVSSIVGYHLHKQKKIGPKPSDEHDMKTPQ